MTVTYNDATYTYNATDLTYDGVTPQFDGVTVTVQAAFGYAPLDIAPVWTDISGYVRNIRIDRGVQSEFVQNTPGTATIRLDNRSRVFDPAYTAGTFYGQLNPMVPIRVQAAYGGAAQTLFTGFAQGWPTAYEVSNTDAVTTLSCTDATQILASQILPVNYEKIVGEDAGLALYFPLQETGTNGINVAFWDSTNNYAFRLNQEHTANLTDVVAPVQPGKGFRVDSAYNATGTHAKGLEDLIVRGDTAGFFPYNPFFDAPLKTLEFWLYGVDADRWDNFTNEEVVIVENEDGTLNREMYISCEVRDDGDAFRINYYTDTVGHSAILTGVTLMENSANHIVITATATNAQMYVNGVLRYDQPFNDTYKTYASSGQNTFFVIYPYVNRLAHAACYYETFDAAKVTDHYDAGYGYIGDRTDERLTRTLDDAGWPTVWRDLEEGVQTVGAYRAAGVQPSSYMQEVDNAEQGKVFVNRAGHVEMLNRDTMQGTNIVASFDDNNVDLPFTDIVVNAHNISAITNSVTAKYRFGSVERTDAGSIAAYGIQNESVNVGLIDDADDATAIADTIIATKKDPRTIVKQLNINVRADVAGLVPAMSGLELGDDITVSFTPTGVGDALWRAVTVQGLTHTISRDGWRSQLYLRAGSIDVNGALLVLNDDTYGKLDDGNKLG
jgi:hypothetical protein